MYTLVQSLLINIYFLALYALALLGLLVVLNYAYENLRSPALILKALTLSILRGEDSNSLVKRFGKWAVVTGSTDGIGKHYALELAKRGFNIVLVARNLCKLEQTSEEILSRYKVEVKIIQTDFSDKRGQVIYDELFKKIEGLEIGVLVNNVGMMSEYPETVDKIPEDVLWNMVQVNISSVTMMCRLMIPIMLAQGKGAIVNVGSSTDTQPTANGAVYVASKKYVRYLTNALQLELSNTNLTIQLLSPFFVMTKMNNYSRTVMDGGLFFPNVEKYTKFAVSMLGKTPDTTGFWAHGIQVAFVGLLPLRLRAIFTRMISTDIKNDYLKTHKRQL